MAHICLETGNNGTSGPLNRCVLECPPGLSGVKIFGQTARNCVLSCPRCVASSLEVGDVVVEIIYSHRNREQLRLAHPDANSDFTSFQ